MHHYLHAQAPLLGANSVDEVRRVMHKYLTALSPEAVAAWPASCREALTAHDIAGSALILTRTELTHLGKPEVMAALYEVAKTYIAASNRIVQLQGRGEPVANNP